MIRRSTVIWSAIAVGVGIGMFFVKHRVQDLEARLASVQRDIAEDRGSIHVLKAEWSYLNQPARLEDLGQRLLRLRPIDADQAIDITELDERLEHIAETAVPAPARPAPRAGNAGWVAAIMADLEKRR